MPAVSFITDFAYHPFWAHRGVDLNLAVHPATVEAVKRKTGRPSMARGPLVDPTFSLAPGRKTVERARLGLRPDDLAILISSGSWGVGAVKRRSSSLRTSPGSSLLLPAAPYHPPPAARGHRKNRRLPSSLAWLDR